MNSAPTRMRPGLRRVLLIDDDADLLTLQEMALRDIPNLELASVTSAEEALALITRETFDLVLTDLNLPARSGIEFITTARSQGFHAPILVLSAYGSVASATDALRAGAADFLQKPVLPDRLRALVVQLLSSAPAVGRSETPIRDAQPARAGETEFEGILGISPAMRAVFERVERVAQTEATVLIVGESGTGKELIARALHRRSARARGPLVPVHTGAIPRELIASELFGHEKGSFTGAVAAAEGKFEAAQGGTLFLDEIGTMDSAVQVALLRVLETFKYTRVGGRVEHQADVRIVAATNRDLLEMVQAGTFREDLYYRLNVFAIPLPPLRERPDDIALIAEHYLRGFATRYRTAARRLSPGALDRLASHDWPGNVRELRNVMEQTVVFARGELVDADEVQLISTHIATPAARAQATQQHPVSVAPGTNANTHTHAAPPPAPSNPSTQPLQPPQSSQPMNAGATSDPRASTFEPRTHATAPVAPLDSPWPARPRSVPPADPYAARARSTLGITAASFTDDDLVLRFPIGTTVDQVEQQLLLRTLEVVGGNKQRAARVLGISRRCLYNKLATYGLGPTIVEPDAAESDADAESDAPPAS